MLKFIFIEPFLDLLIQICPSPSITPTKKAINEAGILKYSSSVNLLALLGLALVLDIPNLGNLISSLVKLRANAAPIMNMTKLNNRLFNIYPHQIALVFRLFLQPNN